MALREWINRNPGITTGVTLGIVVVVLGFIVWRFSSSEQAYAPPTDKAYFSDDDGASYFVDDRWKIPPFEHNGKIAYGAEMFTCDGGRTLFVGWLRRYTPEAKRRREQNLDRAKEHPAALLTEIEDMGATEIKKPRTGDKGWVREIDPAAEAVRQITCPDGTTENLEPAPPPQ